VIQYTGRIPQGGVTVKRRISNIVFIVITIFLIVAVTAFYFYDVLCLKHPYTDNLFKALSVVCLLIGTLIRLFNVKGRKSLEIYEKSYADELGFAFKNKAFQRKKLLCACRLYNEGNYDKALKYLFALLKEAEFERDAVPVWLFIALCYTDAGVNAQAIKAYYQLLRLDPNNAQVHSNLGSLLVAEGDFEAALKHYNESIEIRPENYYAYINRANYYFRINDYENAVADARKALKYKNNGVEAASLLTVIYALLEDDENKRYYYHLSITSGKKPKDLDDAIEYFLSEKNIIEEEEEA